MFKYIRSRTIRASAACASILLATLLSFTLSCQGGRAGFDHVGSSPKTPLPEAGPAAAPGGSSLPALPSPAQLARSTSELPAYFAVGGHTPTGLLPVSRCDTSSFDRAVFSPVQAPGEGLDKLAYAGYMLRPHDEDNGAKELDFQWFKAPQGNADFWVGLADFKHNRWIWLPGPAENGSLDIAASFEDYLTPTGELFLEVLICGQESVELQSLKLGEPTADIELFANPEAAIDSLDTELSVYFYVLGDEVSFYEWDLDEDGIYEIAGETTYTCQHVYDTLGSHFPRVRVHCVSGRVYSASRKLVVIKPGNLSPQAELTADPPAGDGPLEVTVSAAGSFDPEGGLLQYEWDLNADGEFELSTGTRSFVTTTLGRAGPNTLRAKVIDEYLAWAEAEVTVNLAQGWDVQPIAGSADCETDVSLAVVGSGPGRHPALVSIDSLTRDLVYFDGAPDASSFSLPVKLGNGACDKPTLFDVDGAPAIAYSRVNSSVAPAQKNLRYVRALDANGATWPLSVLVGADIANYDLHAAVINSRPALVSLDDDGQVWFARASDSAGLLWPEPQIVHTETGSMKVFSTRLLSATNKIPSIFFGQYGYEGILADTETVQLPAVDLSASSFAAPVKIMDHRGTNIRPVYNQNNICIAACDGWEPFDGLVFASNPDGGAASWLPTQKLDLQHSAGRALDMQIFQGRPLLVYARGKSWNEPTGQLLARQALDAAGAVWEDPVVIEPHYCVDDGCSLVICLDGSPVVAYRNGEKELLYTARLH